EPIATESIQASNFGRRERRRILPHRAMSAISERMLGVELKLVDLEPRQPIHKLQQRKHFRHFVAADVEHDAADGDIGLVLDIDKWKIALAGKTKLAQRGYCMVKADWRRGGDHDSGTINLKSIGLIP